MAELARVSGGTGVLLLNVGSPDAPTRIAVYQYLRQFLMDGRVLDMPWLSRWLLVNLVIAPFRSGASAERYASVWTPRGSPLVAITEDLVAALSSATGLQVAFGMAYGSPSVEHAVSSLRRCERVIVVPLFPQYATATTASVVAGACSALAAGNPVPAVTVLPAFGADPGFLDVLAASARPHLDGVEHLLCSFHGLPERQVTALDAACLTDGCCDRPCSARWSCYRAACLDTAKGLGERLPGVPLSVAFQSRLGRDRWLGPETGAELQRLAKEGKRRVAVACPSFVTDCLESLEEIAVEARETFRAAGGEELVVLPCLNTEPAWVDWLAGWVSAPAAPPSTRR